MSAAVQLAIPTSYLVDRKLLSRVPLTAETLIGRETGFNATGISKRHCIVRFHRNQFYVADMNSKFGTFLNDTRLAPNQWQPLTIGDQLRVGTMGFRLESELGAPPTTELQEDGPILAGMGARWIAAALDQLFIGLLMFGVARLYPPFTGSVTLCERAIVVLLVIVLPMALLSQTLGKKIMGLKVVTEDGEPLTLSRILSRDILLKLAAPIMLAVLVGFSVRINPYAPLIGLATLLILFLMKYRDSGFFYWDEACKTRVVHE